MLEPSEVAPRGPWSLRLELRAELVNLRIVRWAVAEVAALVGLSSEASAPLELCAVEAVTNIIRHGYGEDATRVFYCEIAIGEEQIVLRCEDEGHPIPEEQWREATRIEDTDDEHLVSEGGRGLFLLCELMDSVDYAAGKPNVLIMRKAISDLL